MYKNVQNTKLHFFRNFSTDLNDVDCKWKHTFANPSLLNFMNICRVVRELCMKMIKCLLNFTFLSLTDYFKAENTNYYTFLERYWKDLWNAIQTFTIGFCIKKISILKFVKLHTSMTKRINKQILHRSNQRKTKLLYMAEYTENHILLDSVWRIYDFAFLLQKGIGTFLKFDHLNANPKATYVSMLSTHYAYVLVCMRVCTCVTFMLVCVCKAKPWCYISHSEHDLRRDILFKIISAVEF